MKRKWVTMAVIGVFSANAFPKVNFSGDMAAVSTYVFRGVKQNSGPALQTTARFGYKALTAGIWCSSVDFGGPVETETDPFIELALPTGRVPVTIGLTVYSYDMLDAFNDGADMEFEAYGKVGLGPIGLAGYFVPKQGSTENGLNESLYWGEVSGSKGLCGAVFSAVLGYGTYSSRFLAEPKKDAVGALAISASRTVRDGLTATYTYSLGLDDAVEDVFIFGITKSL
ncbi:hypothetical protein JW777_05025 [bacterium]|nr:hypothetical protein [bacterium]